jgi:hypothetical protein
VALPGINDSPHNSKDRVSAARPILRLGNSDPPDNRQQNGTNYSNAGKVPARYQPI